MEDALHPYTYFRFLYTFWEGLEIFGNIWKYLLKGSKPIFRCLRYSPTIHIFLEKTLIPLIQAIADWGAYVVRKKYQK